MGCAVIKSGNEHVVRKAVIDEATLDRVAELLGISKAERDRIIAGAEAIHIYRGTWSSSGGPPSPSAPPSPPGGG